jgi:hypothetical protein
MPICGWVAATISVRGVGMVCGMVDISMGELIVWMGFGGRRVWWGGGVGEGGSRWFPELSYGRMGDDVFE